MTTILVPSSLSAIPTISLLEKCKTMTEIQQIHAQLIKTNLINHTLTASKVIASCCELGLSDSLDYALSIFLRVEKPNPFIFFSLIKGFSDSSDSLRSVMLYAHLLYCLENFHGVEFSIPSVLKACGQTRSIDEGKQLHGQILKNNLWFDLFVSNSLLRMYLDLGQTEIARQVFDKMPERDLISWNSIVTGYLRAGEIKLAHRAFCEMPERDIVSCNAMINGYGKHGNSELAENIFKTMTHKDVVTWTSMMSAYVLNSQPRKALDIFRDMFSLGVRPDAPAIVIALSAVANLGFVEEGKWIHTYISANKMNMNSSFTASALIDMYAKCGQIESANHVFSTISQRRNIGDWNSIISGFALNGLCSEAVETFLKLEKAEIKPDHITFLALLSACNHGGKVNEGKFYFKYMQEKYKLVPKIQHYGCIIDLFSRAGQLEDAVEVLNNMPVQADALAWKAILSGSLKQGNIAVGENAALKAIELAPEDSSSYVLLSNIYAKVGRWNDVAKIRTIMKRRGVRKIPGCSTIIVNGKVHEFLVGMEMDVKYIEEVVSKLKSEGYKPDKSQVLLDIEDEEKDYSLSLHSDKMALAFGLINIKEGACVHIVKNLRICCDCHSFMKLVSSVYKRRVVVRDQNRFHHFVNGACSCNGYW